MGEPQEAVIVFGHGGTAPSVEDRSRCPCSHDRWRLEKVEGIEDWLTSGSSGRRCAPPLIRRVVRQLGVLDEGRKRSVNLPRLVGVAIGAAATALFAWITIRAKDERDVAF